MADIALQLQADNLPAETIETLLVEGHWAPVLARLKTGENLLLEGCRGVGKTMLMRAAAARLASDHRRGGKVLGVHTTFKRYLATIPPPGPDQDQELGNFKAWVNARILAALKAQLDAVFGDQRLTVDFVDTVDWLRAVGALETTYRGQGVNSTLTGVLAAGLTETQFAALQGYTLTTETLLSVQQAFGLELIVLLLDDAAHALDTRAQGAFFTLIKSLYSPGLAFKISVYPAVTRYGLDFSYGHDAVVVSLGDIPSAQRMQPYIDLLERRLQVTGGRGETDSLIRVLLRDHPEWVRLMVYCSNGNPRGLLKIVSQLLTELEQRGPEQVRYDDARTAINFVIDRHLENMVPGIIKDFDPRLLRAAELLLDAFRDRLRESPGPLQGDQARMFLAITNSMQVPYLCTAATRLLVAANVLTPETPIRLSKRENGTAYLLHPGFVFRDNVLGQFVSGGTVPAERWLQHFDGMSSRVHAEIARTAALWSEVRDEAGQEPNARCVNGHPMMEATGVCEQCGARGNPRGPAEVLLEKDVSVLDLSLAIKQRLRDHGFTTVRRLFEAGPEEIDDIPYIGEIRLKEIRSAVEAAVDEFFAG